MKTSTITFRLTDKLKMTIAKIAERETRNLSQQVEFFVKKGIEDYIISHPDFAKDEKRR